MITATDHPWTPKSILGARKRAGSSAAITVFMVNAHAVPLPVKRHCYALVLPCHCCGLVPTPAQAHSPPRAR